MPDGLALPPEDETPERARRRVAACGTALAQAELALKAARDAEVQALAAAASKEREGHFSRACPVVSRGGTTVGERDAWVAAYAAEERFAAELATAGRQAAKDHLDVVRDQAMLSMALLKSIDAAFSVAMRTD